MKRQTKHEDENIKNNDKGRRELVEMKREEKGNKGTKKKKGKEQNEKTENRKCKEKVEMSCTGQNTEGEE